MASLSSEEQHSSVINQSQISTSTVNNSSSNSFGPKLSIKLQESNFLLWNQQVEGVITSHKMHRFVVNPQISLKYKSEADRLANSISEEYESWLVQDQLLFTWLLSTLSEPVLPRVLLCKHAFEVWGQIHKHFYTHLKA